LGSELQKPAPPPPTPKFHAAREEARTMTVEEMVAFALEDILPAKLGEPQQDSSNSPLS